MKLYEICDALLPHFSQACDNWEASVQCFNEKIVAIETDGKTQDEIDKESKKITEDNSEYLRDNLIPLIKFSNILKTLHVLCESRKISIKSPHNARFLRYMVEYVDNIINDNSAAIHYLFAISDDEDMRRARELANAMHKEEEG